jgi:Protein of unknown function (DUF1656)
VKEFVVAGLLISPFVKYALIASLILIPTRIIRVACHFHRWFWHPLLAESRSLCASSQ